MTNLEATARRLFRQGKYDEALPIIDQALAELGPLPHLLILKGNCLELGSDIEGSPFDEPKTLYASVLDHDPRNIDALLDYAWFIENMEDKPREARPLFKRALRKAERQFISVCEGYVQTIAETFSRKRALQVLDEIYARVRTNKALRKLRREIIEGVWSPPAESDKPAVRLQWPRRTKERSARSRPAKDR